ncbi:hypothetical protein TELCIR_02434 [Teladorsagia circumcincta]|uniref:Uncharacterized protein n=1 Tax=Teladorsagia circumcincta TaxID=45464 RepID=A0A2G9V182_TELCI|nr:hypothetical protein TELCIR_02434 [Teladorsagia circumcincta]
MQESKFEEEMTMFDRATTREEYFGTQRLVEQVETERAVVSAKATTQEEVAISVLHLGSEDNVEESRLVRPKADHEAASQQFKEAADESAVGFWTTSDLDVQVEGRLLQKTASSQSIEKRLTAVSEKDTAAETSLEWHSSKSAQRVLKQKEQEMVKREFKVKTDVQDASLFRKEEIARDDITMFDIEKEMVTSRAFEYGQESSSLQGMFGKLIPKPESAEEVGVDCVANVTLQQKMSVAASKESGTEKELKLRRDDSGGDIAAISIIPLRDSAYFVGSAPKEELCNVTEDLLSQQPRSESSEVLVMGRHEEAVQMKSSATSEMEAFGFWDSNVPIKDTSCTLRTKSFESLVLGKKLRGSTEAQTQMSSVLTQEAKEERAVKWKQAQSASVDKAFGISTKTDEFLMNKAMTSAGSAGTLQERLVAKQKQMIRQYSDESALLFGSLGSLTPRTPESEETSTSLSDVPVLRGAAFMVASSEEVTQATGKIKRDDSAESAELLKKVGAFKSVKLSSQGSTESRTALSTMHRLESQEKASAQAILSIAVKDVISLMSPESTEEYVSSSWKTGEGEGDAASIQIGIKKVLCSSKSMSAASQSSTDYAGELTREVRGDRTAILPEIPADAAGGNFEIHSRDDHVFLSSAPKSMRSTEVFSTTLRKATSAKLQEFGRAAVDLKSVIGTLSAPPQPSEEAHAILPTKEAVLLSLGTKATSEHVAELLKLLSKHDQLAEMELIRSIVLREEDKLSVGAVRSLSTAITLALEKSSVSSSIGAIIAARLHEEASAFMQFASDEFVSGTWSSVASIAEARSQWPEYFTAAVEQKSKAPALTSSSVEVTIGMSPEEVTLCRNRLPLLESVQRLFYVELETALTEIRREEASEADTTTIPVSRTETVKGIAREYGKAEVFAQGVAGTIQQPEENRDSVETTQHRFPSIQAIYSTKATKEEHAELIKSLERFQEHESIEEILEVLRTEQLKFSGFATRTLLKAVEQELSSNPERAELSYNVAEAVRTVLSLAIKEVVDENAFAIIRSSKTASETALVLTLSSVEKLVANVPAISELREKVSSHFTRHVGSSISAIMPIQPTAASRQKFTIEERSVSQDFSGDLQGEHSSRTPPKTTVERTAGAAHEYGRDYAEIRAVLSVIDQPIQQREEADMIKQRAHHLKLTYGVQATEEEQAELVKLLSKYQDDEGVAAIIKEVTSGRVVFSGPATKKIIASIEKEVNRSSEVVSVSARVADTLRCVVTKALKEIVDESTFAIVRTREAISISTLAVALSLLDSTEARVHAPTQETASSDIALATEPSACYSAVLPLQLMSTADRKFAVSAEILHTVLEQVAQQHETARALPYTSVERATSLSREQGEEGVGVSASLQLLPKPLPKDQVIELTSEVPRRLYFTHSIKSSTAEKMELVGLLRKFQDDCEVSKILTDLQSEKIKFNKSVAQAITQSLEELQRTPETETAERTVAETLRSVISKAVEETAHETAFTIVKSIETSSTACLAVALTTSESMMRSLRAIEETEICSTSALSKTLSSDYVSVLPGEHRIQIEEKFGISADSLSTTVKREDFQHSFTGTLKEKQRLRTTAQVRELGQESVEVMADLMLLGRRSEQHEEVELARNQRSYIQFLHSVIATSEENLDLVKMLSKYDDDEDVAIIIKDVLSGRITFSGVATKTISAAVEREIHRSSECFDISRKVSEALRSAISRSLKEVVEESTFSILQTQDIMSTTQLAMMLSSLESVQARVQAPKEAVASTDLDFMKRAVSSRYETLPVHGMSAVERRFAISTEALTSVLESINQQVMKVQQALPLKPAETASTTATEKTAESVETSVSLHRLERPISRDEETETIPGTSRRLGLIYSLRSPTEQQKELLELLKKFQEDAEVSKVMQQLVTEKIEFSSSVTQSIIHSIEELQRRPETFGVERTVAEILRDIISKAVKESLQETTFTIVQSMEKSSTASLAMALSASEAAVRHVRAVEETETSITSELCRSLSNIQESVIPEEYRAYIEERFGITAESLSTSLKHRDALQEATKALKETQHYRASAQEREYGQEFVGLTGNILAVEKQQGAEQHIESIRGQSRYLHMLHSVKATSEEISDLVKLLNKYNDDADVAIVIKDLITGRVSLSGVAVRSVTASVTKEISHSSQASDISQRVSEALRCALSAVVKEIAEENAFTILQTKEMMSTAQLATALAELDAVQAKVQASTEEVISADLDLTQRAVSALSATLPIHGVTSTERQFAISTEVLMSVLENVSQQGKTVQTIPSVSAEEASSIAREPIRPTVKTTVLAQRLQQPIPESRETTTTPTVPRRLYFTHSIKSSTEEKMELIELLKRFEDEAEISEIVRGLVSERIEFSSSMTQSIIHAIKELQRIPETGSTGCTVAQVVREVISTAIKESVHETVFTIVQSVEGASATDLAVALSLSEAVVAHLRSAELDEVHFSAELTKSLSEIRASVILELHRAYIKQRFGIDDASLSAALQRPSAQQSSFATLSEKDEDKTSLQMRELGHEMIEVHGELIALRRPSEEHEGVELARVQHRYLQLLHSMRSTSEEISELVKLLNKYDDDEDIAIIIRDLVSGRVSFSGLAIRTITASVEKEINRAPEACDVSQRVSRALRSAIHAVVKEISEESAFTLLQTKDVISTAHLAMTLAALDSAQASVLPPTATDASTDLDIAQRAHSAQTTIIPIRGISRTARQFAISTEVFTSVLESVAQQGATAKTIPASLDHGPAVATAREEGVELLETGVYAQRFSRPSPSREEIAMTPETSRRLYFTHAIKSSVEEKMELVELLRKFQDEAEVSEIIRDLTSEKIVFSSAVTQSIIRAIKELQKSAETGAEEIIIIQVIRDVISKAVEELVPKSVLTIVESMNESSTAELAAVLSTTEALMSRLRAVEQNEVSLIAELTRSVSHVHELVMPEEHQAYIRERFGISLFVPPPPLKNEEFILYETQVLHSRRATAEETSRLRNLLMQISYHSDITEIVRFLEQENVRFSEKITQDMINSIEEILSRSITVENIASSVVERVRVILSESIRELTDEATFQSFYATPASSSITTLLVAVHSLESVLSRISEIPSALVSVAAGTLVPPHEVIGSHITLEERRRLQLLHLVKASEEQRIHLTETLSRYQHHSEISDVLKIIERLNVELSGRVTSQIISMLGSSTKEGTMENVVDRLRGALLQSVREVTEETAYSMWRTVEPAASLSTLLMTLISLEKVIANVVAPVYSTTSTTSMHERQSSEGVTVMLPESLTTSIDREYKTESSHKSVNVKSAEASEYSAATRKSTERIGSSLTAREFGDETSEASVGLGTLSRPLLQKEEATALFQKQREILLRSAVRATIEEQEVLLKSFERFGDKETADQIVKVLNSLSTKISSTASSEIRTMLDTVLRRAEDACEAQEVVRKKLRETLTRCVGKLTDETVFSLWETRTTVDTSTLVNSLVLLERVALDAFAATYTRTDSSSVLERGSQQYLVTSSSAQRRPQELRSALRPLFQSTQNQNYSRERPNLGKKTLE